MYCSDSFSLEQKADQGSKFFCCWLRAVVWSFSSYSLHLFLSSPLGCLDRLFICPAWARKGYCDSKRKLMQKHCPSSCDFCYGKTQQQKAAVVQGGKKVFSQLSSAAVNRLPMEQREPTGPAMQSCDGGFQESDLKGDYTCHWRSVFRSEKYQRPPGRQCVFWLKSVTE